MISPQPDIKTHEIDPAKDSWMILACDGIWNFMSNQEVVDYINPRIETTPQDKLSLICEEVSHQCTATRCILIKIYFLFSFLITAWRLTRWVTGQGVTT